MNDKINLEAKLASFSEHYQPRTVAQMNDHDVMVVKLKGPFIWHKHDETDDFFLVLTRVARHRAARSRGDTRAGRAVRRTEGRRASAGCSRRSALAADRADGDAQHRRRCTAAPRRLA